MLPRAALDTLEDASNTPHMTNYDGFRKQSHCINFNNNSFTLEYLLLYTTHIFTGRDESTVGLVVRIRWPGGLWGDTLIKPGVPADVPLVSAVSAMA